MSCHSQFGRISLTQVPFQVANAPDGTQACAFDIKSFHRTCPVISHHKPFLVAEFDGGFYLDHCHPFGSASASSNAGQIFNAIMDIWAAETGDGVDTSQGKFEDDAAKFRHPNLDGPYASEPTPTPHSSELVTYRYRFDRDSVVAPIDSIGTPWHLTKTGKKFLDHMVYLGLYWDFIHRRVSLPEEKRTKYLARVTKMLNEAHAQKGFLLLEVQKIHGVLCHICFVYEDGSSRLAVISNSMSDFDGNPFARRRISNSFRDTLTWWRQKLADPSLYRQLRPLGPLRDLRIFVDACTTWGIAVGSASVGIR